VLLEVGAKGVTRPGVYVSTLAAVGRKIKPQWSILPCPFSRNRPGDRSMFLSASALRVVATASAAAVLLAPLSLHAQGRGGRGGASAADSIMYSYPTTARLDALKAEASREIDARAKMIQEMVDQVFS
jgi:hypothetical protein